MFHLNQSSGILKLTMITRPLILVILCFAFFILLQSLVPKVMALKRSSKMNQFMLEDQRTRKRKNYLVRNAQDNEMIGDADNMGVSYDTELYQPDTNPEELSDLFVDYANMMRDDVILLDNSVETRTRKRGNIKMKKHNQVVPDPPCTCEDSNTTLDFGANTFPQRVVATNCKRDGCRLPYVCQETVFNLPLLRRREKRELLPHQKPVDIPDLKLRWVSENISISVGCICARDYDARIG